jgi:DNA-binding transcriptional MerR regulator
MKSEQYRLTTSCVVNRLRERFGVVRTPDTVRMWGRMGRLPVQLLENGQRVYCESDVDELGARLAAEDAQHVA